MALQRTFTMLKPGVLQRRIVGEILTRLERKGFKILALKLMQIPRALAEEHYGEHRERPFFGELVGYVTSAPVVAMVVEGEEGISLLRMLCGATKVDQALPGTIRGDYATQTQVNIIHASDSPESAEREIGLFFKPEEIIDYEDGNAGWL
ncbi:MAG: nucleoside-diphosphate kinase [Spirochaetales bacterium]|nr:MAG: nucleoside-diphosphate kinase [Spirochaetales bacterium]